MILVSAFSEMLSIAIVLPFLGVLTNPESLFSNSFIRSSALYFGYTSGSQLLVPLTILFCTSIIFSACTRILTLFINVRLSFGIGFELSLGVYRRALYQPYMFHIQRNSSEIMSTIRKTGGLIQGILLPFLNVVSSVVLLISILITLFLINPLVATVTLLGFGSIYFLIMRATNGRLKILSTVVSRESTRVGQLVYEGLGGIRDILIDSTQEIFCKIYAKSELPHRYASGNVMLIAIAPHYCIEAIGMTMIGVVAFFLTAYSEGGVMMAVPTLGALVLGAQRMLPILQKIYGSISEMKANRMDLVDSLELMERPLPLDANSLLSTPIKFNKEIVFRNVKFKYSEDTPQVLNGINLTIPKGARIGVIGKTGSGKSTFLDIVMGLLSPIEGELRVDDIAISPQNQKGWQSHIAHVPQAIFIADLPVYQNIAFGVPEEEIDIERVYLAAKKAGISKVIEELKDKYNTIVGERGVRLSGGQRQRLGIARALYKNADVIILDEATSALDNDTEEEVIKSIIELNKDVTIIMVAHRLTTLKSCTYLIEIKAGSIARHGSYEQIVGP
jgi:ATP-binding cassette subfamily B protein